MNGGERIAAVLKEQGVGALFTLCGGHISPILVGAKQRGVRVVDVRHEVDAVFADALGLPEADAQEAAASREVFGDRARDSGVDGVLVLDLPIEEAREFRDAMAERGIDMIFLLSPTTTDTRLQDAARLGTGFLYGISRLGVTGARDTVADGAQILAARMRAATSQPIALGFGVSSPEHVRQIGTFADAAVVGSGLVAIIAEAGGSPDLVERVESYVHWLTQ